MLQACKNSKHPACGEFFHVAVAGGSHGGMIEDFSWFVLMVGKAWEVPDSHATGTVSYTHFLPHETNANVVCRLQLDKKN